MGIQVKGDLHIGTYVERGGKAFVNQGKIENFIAGEGSAEVEGPAEEQRFIEATEVKDAPQLPAMLDNEEGKKLLARMQERNLLDARYQPVNMSSRKMATLAREASMLLWGEQRWTPWIRLWDEPNLRNYYYRAQDQRQNGDVAKELRKMMMEE